MNNRNEILETLIKNLEILKNEDQKKYDVLVEKIRTNPSQILSHEDRMMFYELHEKVPRQSKTIAYFLIEELIKQQTENHRYTLEEVEQKEIFNILESKRVNEGGLNRWEYNYLVFLKFNYNWLTMAETPCWPDIFGLSVDSFKERFVFNETRSKLYGIFEVGMKTCKNEYQLKEINVIIGGSFVDIHKQSPKDIDVIILLPESTFRMDYNRSIFDKTTSETQDFDKDTLDINILPNNYTSNLYMAYELLTLLGNTPAKREDDNICSVSFKCRDIYQINFD